MVSSAIFWREAWSVLPLYFFCTACSSGETICIAREARIWRTNSGMIRVRTTTVRPTMDSTQVSPASGSMNVDSSAWNFTMSHATAHSIGYRGFIGLVFLPHGCACRSCEVAALVGSPGQEEALAARAPQSAWIPPHAGSGDRVRTSPGEGVAAQDPPGGEQEALDRSVHPQGVHAVLGAHRVVPAGGRGVGRDPHLVAAHREHQQ